MDKFSTPSSTKQDNNEQANTNNSNLEMNVDEVNISSGTMETQRGKAKQSSEGYELLHEY